MEGNLPEKYQPKNRGTYDKTLVYQLYWDLYLNRRECGEVFGLSSGGMGTHMERMGIPRRPLHGNFQRGHHTLKPVFEAYEVEEEEDTSPWKQYTD